MMSFLKPITLAILLIAITQSSFACSGWGHVDEDQNGNVLLVKNRDELSTDQLIELRKPLSGNRYIGLFSPNKFGNMLPRAAINEKGLVITSLSVSVLDKKNLLECHGDEKISNLIPHIMANYDSVESVKKNADKLFAYTKPVFYMIADKNEIIYVEIAPKPQYRCNVSGLTKNEYKIFNQDQNGYILHTNHYRYKNFKKYNIKKYQSTYSRLDRLEVLLLDNSKNINSVEQYLKYAHDEIGGPNDSLFRYNIEQNREKTLITWLIKIPKNGLNPVLNVTLYENMLVDKKAKKTIKIESLHKQIILTQDKFNSFDRIFAKSCKVIAEN